MFSPVTESLPLFPAVVITSEIIVYKVSEWYWFYDKSAKKAICAESIQEVRNEHRICIETYYQYSYDPNSQNHREISMDLSENCISILPFVN